MKLTVKGFGGEMKCYFSAVQSPDGIIQNGSKTYPQEIRQHQEARGPGHWEKFPYGQQNKNQQCYYVDQGQAGTSQVKEKETPGHVDGQLNEEKYHGQFFGLSRGIGGPDQE
jgi:hypothetical protein